MVILLNLLYSYCFSRDLIHNVAAHPKMLIRFACMDNMLYNVIVFYYQKCKSHRMDLPHCQICMICMI